MEANCLAGERYITIINDARERYITVINNAGERYIIVINDAGERYIIVINDARRNTRNLWFNYQRNLNSYNVMEFINNSNNNSDNNDNTSINTNISNSILLFVIPHKSICIILVSENVFCKIDIT